MKLLFKKLTEILIWAGRYPVPMKNEKYNESIKIIAQPWKYPDQSNITTNNLTTSIDIPLLKKVIVRILQNKDCKILLPKSLGGGDYVAAICNDLFIEDGDPKGLFNNFKKLYWFCKIKLRKYMLAFIDFLSG